MLEEYILMVFINASKSTLTLQENFGPISKTKVRPKLVF